MSEKIARSFFENLKKYITPVFLTPRVSLKAFVVYSLWGITPIIHIIFIQRLVYHIEAGAKEDFFYMLTIYGIYNIFYEILDFSMKKWGWVENINEYRKIIDAEYIERFIKTNNSDIEKQGTGKLVSIITQGSDTWALSLDTLLLEILRIFYVAVFGVYMIFGVSYVLGFSFIFCYICIIILGAYFNKKSLYWRQERMHLWNLYVKKYVKILMSKIEIMQSNKTQLEIQQIQDLSDSIIEVNKKMALSVYLCYRIAEAGVIWMKILILLYAGLGVIEGTLSLSFFVGLFGIMAILESTVVQTMKFFRNFTKDFTKIQNLWDFFDTTPEITGYEEGNIFSYKTGDISLQNLNYSYEGNKNVFENFDLKITGGRVTAFVGPSGGGKSTLVKLIAGYLKAERGDILIDGQKLSETSLKSYYQDVGYLTQEPSVFDGTVRENLMYAITGEEIEEKKLQEIISLAHCEFIYDLPQGLDTEIGERGVKLSGGQKQRLAIAKIFLKNPKIIILDEPTSALDSLSEKKITEAMHNLFQNRTVLVIAHRLQTVKYADDIIVIEQGKIIERGNHESLVEKKGYYAEMLELQSGF